MEILIFLTFLKFFSNVTCHFLKRKQKKKESFFYVEKKGYMEDFFILPAKALIFVTQFYDVIRLPLLKFHEFLISYQDFIQRCITKSD